MADGSATASGSSETILDIEGVTKRFGGVTAVRGATLRISRGRVTSLIGPNGAGKTTLFNAITGCIPATEGKIVFHTARGSHAVQRLRPDQITRLGIARTFQNIRLFSNLSVMENVMIGFHPRTHANLAGAIFRPPHVKREERLIFRSARRCLEFCGLHGYEHAVAGSLPYGLQRRLEIARALATGPSLLLLDEPAAGMNPAESQELLALIRKILDNGVTVLLIEHDMRVVMTVSDCIFVLDYGEIIAHGEPAAIRGNPRVIEAYLGKEHSAAGRQTE